MKSRGLFLCLPLAIVSLVGAEESSPKVPQKTQAMLVRGGNDRGPAQSAGPSFSRARFGGRAKLEDGEYAIGFVVYPKGSYYIGSDVMASYPPLKKGAIIPVFSQFFHITEFPWGRNVLFRAVDDDKVPEAIRLTPPSFVIPCRSEKERNEQNKGGIANVFDEFVMLKSIQGQGKAAKALLIVNPSGHKYRTPKGSAWLKAGDIFFIGGYYLAVNRVVPPDDETGIIGWIEFNGRPILNTKLPDNAVIVRAIQPVE